MKPRLRFLMWILIAGGVHGFLLFVPRPAGRGDEGIPTIELSLVEGGAGEAGAPGPSAPAPRAAPLAQGAAPTPRPAAREEAPALSLPPPVPSPPAVEAITAEAPAAVAAAAPAALPALAAGSTSESAGSAGGGSSGGSTSGGEASDGSASGRGTGTAVGVGGSGSGSGAGATAGLIPPRPRTGISPVYPRGARAAGIQGTIVVAASIDASGIVLSVEVSTSSGNASLDRAALAAVRRTSFKPAVRDGKPVAYRALIPVQFQLQ